MIAHAPKLILKKNVYGLRYDDYSFGAATMQIKPVGEPRTLTPEEEQRVLSATLHDILGR